MKVANSTPQAKEVAIGKKGAVFGVIVVINGMRPTKVVKEVRIIGLNLTVHALTIASWRVKPSLCCRFA